MLTRLNIFHITTWHYSLAVELKKNMGTRNQVMHWVSNMKCVFKQNGESGLMWRYCSVVVNLHPKLPQVLHPKLPHPESLIMAHI